MVAYVQPKIVRRSVAEKRFEMNEKKQKTYTIRSNEKIK